MAYQNVGTPRFYIDWFSYAKAIGIDIPDSQYDYHPPVGINPSNTATAAYTGTPSNMSIFRFGDDYSVIMPNTTPINFIAVLGHNYAGRMLDPHFHNIDDNFNYISGFYPTFTDICNWGESTTILKPAYDGFSIGGISNMSNGTVNNLGLFTLYQNSTHNPNTPYTYKSGSCIVGNYYDMPHSPDLNLTMTREYGGIKTLETKSGASLSNDFGSSPPKWGDRSAWQLGDQDFSTGGRRLWSLSFSFLSDSSVFPDNPTEISDGGGWEVDDTTPDFISEVVKKCNGGQLPFIFQPNTDENIFAICKFDQNSFSFQQTAPNLYSCKVRIRECW